MKTMWLKAETSAKEMGDIRRVLEVQQNEIQENVRELDGWADRIMRAILNV